MLTIAGPLSGVISVRTPELVVKPYEGGWRVLWSQMIKEEGGWDQLLVGSSDKTTYITSTMASQARARLINQGEQAP